MRIEKGYICSVEFEGAKGEFWFGPKTNPGEKTPLNLSARFDENGLRPFPIKEDAERARIEILQKRKGVEKIELAEIELDMAETVEEFELLEGDESLVVVAHREGMSNILGSASEGGQKIGYIPGALIETNGRRPFTEFSQALYSAEEVWRQAQSRATIARFKIQTVDPLTEEV